MPGPRTCAFCRLTQRDLMSRMAAALTSAMNSANRQTSGGSIGGVNESKVRAQYLHLRVCGLTGPPAPDARSHRSCWTSRWLLSMPCPRFLLCVLRTHCSSQSLINLSLRHPPRSGCWIDCSTTRRVPAEVRQKPQLPRRRPTRPCSTPVRWAHHL